MPPWLPRPPNFSKMLSGQISLYGKYLFLTSWNWQKVYVSPILFPSSLFFAQTLISLRRRRLSHVRVRRQKWRSQLLKQWLKQCFVSRRTEKKKQRKHYQLAQIIKVINTLATLLIVIPELTKFRMTNCLGHLHIVRMPLTKPGSLLQGALLRKKRSEGSYCSGSCLWDLLHHIVS